MLCESQKQTPPGQRLKAQEFGCSLGWVGDARKQNVQGQQKQHRRMMKTGITRQSNHHQTISHMRTPNLPPLREPAAAQAAGQGDKRPNSSNGLALMV